MDRKEYSQIEVQQKVREAVNTVIVEQGIRLPEVARLSGISYSMVHHFIGKEKRAGKEVIRRFLTFISAYGYDHNTIERKED